MRSVLEGLPPEASRKIDSSEREIIERAEALANDQVASWSTEIDRQDKLPEEPRRRFHEAGLMTMQAPADWGGGGASLTTQCLAAEAVSRRSASLAEVLTAQGTSMLTLLTSPDSDGSRSLFKQVKRNGWLLAFALFEHDSEFNPFTVATVATRDGRDWILSGSKAFCSNGGGTAEYHLVFARTGERHQNRGVSTFVVNSSSRGFELGKRNGIMGLRGSITTTLHLTGVRVPGEYLLAPEGEGYSLALPSIIAARLFAGAVSAGIAVSALEYCLEYAKIRRQFGSPLTSFQAIQFKLADMAISAERARTFLYKTTDYFGRTSSAQAGNELSKRAAIVKTFASDTAMKVATDAVQVMGGQGWLRSHPVERMMRDAKTLQVLHGPNHLQRLSIGQHLLDLAGGAQ